MTQVNSAQRASKKLASTPRARTRTLAQRRADFEQQIRSCMATDATMALTEPEQVRRRMKELRARAGNPSQYEVAHEVKVPPRTFQSWENAEVETDRKNYERVATYYSRKLKQKVTANWILFGQDKEPPLSTPTARVTMDGVPDDLQAQLSRIEEAQDRTEQKLNELAGLIAQLLLSEEPEEPPSEQRASA